MSDSDLGGGALGATIGANDRKGGNQGDKPPRRFHHTRQTASVVGWVIKKVWHWIPGFTWILVAYTIFGLNSILLQPAVSFSNRFVWTGDNILLFVAGLIALVELLRVSKPGVDNTVEAVAMLVMFIVFLLLFVLALVGLKPLSVFDTGGFLMLTIVNGMQALVALMVNARTLKRTIDYGGASGHGG